MRLRAARPATRREEAMPVNAVELTRELIRFNTINPPGNEGPAAEHLGSLLEAAGARCSYVPLAEGRPNLVARIGGSNAGPPLGFTGHTDTVPLGLQPWTVDPHAADVKDGKIWGRGASDMKSGVAAFVAAAIDMAPQLDGTAGVILYITAGEETGSEGAFALASAGIRGEAGALVVAEPTSNRALCGHKGALWLKAIARGVTAHGSMPGKGVNAVYAAARAVSKLEEFQFNIARHPVMGGPTLNVGWMHGGINVNSVPDRAEVGIDIRSIPGQRHARVRDEISSALGSEIEVETMVDVESVWTEAETAWMRQVFDVCETVQGARPSVDAAPYFTDASALTPALGGVPTVILGPGPAHMAHQTDEWCEIARIEEAAEVYRRLIAGWCGV
jgi:succinyl-diaminopimelate desuccinylase